MMQPTGEIDRLRTHIQGLRYAIATTSCRETVVVVQRMLGEAEAKLRKVEQRQAA